MLMHQSIPQEIFVDLAKVRWVGSVIHIQILETSGKSFLQNEGGYRDGLELQKGRKKRMEKNHTELHDTILISLWFISL